MNCIKDIKLLFILLSISLMLFSCELKKMEPLYDFLNQTVIVVFDNVVQERPRSNKYCFNVSNKLLNLDDIYSDIKNQISTDTSLKEFYIVLNSISKDSVLEVSKIINTDKYNLKHTDSKDCTAVEGKISFFRPLISANMAILPMLKWDSKRSGYASAFYFRKENGKWKFIKEKMLYII